jgi:predicted ABC-type transport system involved in lysophospholipase L1 biosynthesis ATPase subunit
VVAVTHHVGLAERTDRRIHLVDGTITADDAAATAAS